MRYPVCTVPPENREHKSRPATIAASACSMRTRADKDREFNDFRAELEIVCVPRMEFAPLLDTLSVDVRLGVLRTLSSVALIVHDQDTYISGYEAWRTSNNVQCVTCRL